MLSEVGTRSSIARHAVLALQSNFLPFLAKCATILAIDCGDARLERFCRQPEGEVSCAVILLNPLR